MWLFVSVFMGVGINRCRSVLSFISEFIHECIHECIHEYSQYTHELLMYTPWLEVSYKKTLYA